MNERQWFENRKNLLELCVFLVQTDELISASEMFHFLSFPKLYTEVWELYIEQIGQLDEGYT